MVDPNSKNDPKLQELMKVRESDSLTCSEAVASCKTTLTLFPPPHDAGADRLDQRRPGGGADHREGPG